MGARRASDFGEIEIGYPIQAEEGEDTFCITVAYDNQYSSQFVAHPNVQQLLAAIWYEGLPGFRRKGMVGQIMQVARFGMMFPVYSMIYMIAPSSVLGKFMKKPFVKFICHSSSYAFFLSESNMSKHKRTFKISSFPLPSAAWNGLSTF